MIADLARTASDLAPSKALTHGLEILRLLTEAGRPMTSTEIASQVGLHQSSASRILRTLMAAGYVRKPDYHSFAADFGVLTLGASALKHFPVVSRPRAAMNELAERTSGLMCSLVTLWHGQLIYLLRVQQGHEPVLVSASGYPLHLSSPGLRILLAWPEEEALAALAASRTRFGWERPSADVPADEAACLKRAAELLRHDILALKGWQGPNRLTAAIPVEAEGVPPLTLAISGPADALPFDTVMLLMQEGRRAVEAALREPAKR
ncbi:MAG: helix-turn-helix domain-containing protein [Planctomycetes bacterium]|nr:helix-turn-helix domain-containing protein [Planctomycetota bacterium]